MKDFRSLTVRLALALLAAPLFSSEPRQVGSFVKKDITEPFKGLKIYHYEQKKSGLDIYLVPQPESTVVAYVTAFNVGSRFEVEGHTGLAHLFEHMMFRGTESFPEPFKTLSGWGDRFNAYTSYDLTLYHELVPKEVFPEAMRFESERMRKLAITRQGFDIERQAVVSERKMSTEDSPFGRLYWELYQLGFDTHPYKVGVIGWQEDLNAASFEDALDFYKRFYAPNRAKIVVVGGFDLKSALEMFEKNYGSFGKVDFKEPVIAPEKVRKDYRRKVLPMRVDSVYLADGALGPKYNDAEAPVDALMCALLADSKMGFLSLELVEKGIAQSVSSDCTPNYDRGLSTIFLVGNPGVKVDALEKAYDEARGKFPAWLTKERVEKAKLFFLAEKWQSLRDPMNLAEQLGRMVVTTGDPLYSFRFLEKLEKANLKDVKRRFAELKQNHTRLILEPSDKTAPLGKNVKTGENKGS